MVTAFLPCRAGSERVPHKNTKPFAGIKGGLLSVKLTQLLNVDLIDKIVLSTNDPQVVQIAQNISDKIIIERRPENLALSSTSTDELLEYIPTIIKNGHILWTHATSPFLSVEHYNNAIAKYQENLKSDLYDSLMTVTKVQTFLWDSNGSFNYDRRKEKWPRTQTLPPLFEVNSGMFINSVENFVKYKDRIGTRPYLMETNGISSLDVDWPEDFELAEKIYKSLL